VALDLVAISVLLSKIELPGKTSKPESSMQHCVWLGLFVCVAQIIALAMGWNGMNRESFSMFKSRSRVCSWSATGSWASC
jgi:hypothetical protein